LVLRKIMEASVMIMRNILFVPEKIFTITVIVVVIVLMKQRQVIVSVTKLKNAVKALVEVAVAKVEVAQVEVAQVEVAQAEVAKVEVAQALLLLQHPRLLHLQMHLQYPRLLHLQMHLQHPRLLHLQVAQAEIAKKCFFERWVEGEQLIVLLLIPGF